MEDEAKVSLRFERVVNPGTDGGLGERWDVPTIKFYGAPVFLVRGEKGRISFTHDMVEQLHGVPPTEFFRQYTEESIRKSISEMFSEEEINEILTYLKTFPLYWLNPCLGWKTK